FTSLYFAAAFFPSGDRTSQLLATAGIFAAGFFMRPLGGWLFGWIGDRRGSTRTGRRTSMIASALATLAAAPILFALADVTSPVAAFLLVLAGLVIASFYTSISGLVKAELFPTEVRALGIGFTYSIANAAFGGTAEYVALWFKSAGRETWFAWYVAVMAAIALAASLWMPDPSRYGYLEGRGEIERRRSGV
ncbi:MAG: hypothetical protein JO134_06280, partial [Xanthobacteraceae bacterium]|nr:hypothetical protein [Xanthobacteraceae bacterium]